MTDIVWAVRHIIAQVERRVHRPPSSYPMRRALRRFRRRLFASRGFQRIASATDDTFELYSLCALAQTLFGAPRAELWGRENLREYADAAVQARSDVERAAQILRRYAEQVSDEQEKTVLANAAVNIEWSPSLASDKPPDHWTGYLDCWDWNLMGQGLSDRAFTIRHLDRRIPKSVKARNAAIAEIVRLIRNDDTSSQLVRSTLLNGQT